MSDDTFFASSGASPGVTTSNINYAMQICGLTEISSLAHLFHHPFIKGLPTALRIKTLRLFHLFASEGPATPMSVLMMAFAFATRVIATENGAVRDNCFVLLTEIANEWESALDCAERVVRQFEGRA
ncbi:MAG TPA: hypothetical protein VKQ28_16680 [Candidatus Acidoferrum sp.]|nr:hypothetical protein [Candidatus Acidoferrum sp.]